MVEVTPERTVTAGNQELHSQTEEKEMRIKLLPAENKGTGRYNRARRRRRALPITDTELKLIAAAAIIGLSRMPKNG
jgi:hypothetical protein